MNRQDAAKAMAFAMQSADGARLVGEFVRFSWKRLEVTDAATGAPYRSPISASARARSSGIESSPLREGARSRGASWPVM